MRCALCFFGIAWSRRLRLSDKTFLLRLFELPYTISGYVHTIFVTTQVDRLKVDRLKEKTCAITQSQNRLEPLTGDGVMGIIIALQPSA
jgi:hypothetical protein